MNHLELQKRNPIAEDLLKNLKIEISKRRDETLTGLLKVLHNPKALKQKDRTGVLRLASRPNIEKLTKSLLSNYC